MTKDEILNMIMSRFEEAAQLHSAINIFKLRFHGNPALPILIKLVADARDEILELGIQEYGLFKIEERLPESRTTVGDNITIGN